MKIEWRYGYSFMVPPPAPDPPNAPFDGKVYTTEQVINHLRGFTRDYNFTIIEHKEGVGLLISSLKGPEWGLYVATIVDE